MAEIHETCCSRSGCLWTRVRNDLDLAVHVFEKVVRTVMLGFGSGLGVCCDDDRLEMVAGLAFT